jgi:hypothetical protein
MARGTRLGHTALAITSTILVLINAYIPNDILGLMDISYLSFLPLPWLASLHKQVVVIIMHSHIYISSCPFRSSNALTYTTPLIHTYIDSYQSTQSNQKSSSSFLPLHLSLPFNSITKDKGKKGTHLYIDRRHSLYTYNATHHQQQNR